MLLLPLSSALLQVTKTVLTTSTHLLKEFHYSFSLLMLSTAMLTEIKCDSLHYLAVLRLLTHWHLHLLYIQSMFCSRASCISCHWLFHLFVKESCLFYSHFYLHFQSSSLHETTKSCRFEACIFNFQLNFSLIISQTIHNKRRHARIPKHAPHPRTACEFLCWLS